MTEPTSSHSIDHTLDISHTLTHDSAHFDLLEDDTSPPSPSTTQPPAPLPSGKNPLVTHQRASIDTHQESNPFEGNTDRSYIELQTYKQDTETLPSSLNPSPSATPPPLQPSAKSVPTALVDRIGFFIFLIIFYVGSKGLSQLFASYVATKEHLAAPIYLTAMEYLMWTILGSIHRFTQDELPKEAEDSEMLALVVSETPSASLSPASASGTQTPCTCHCRCPKCRRPFIVEQWPLWRTSIAYLSGELVKTVLEVMTVANVELSLALVLLATAPLFSILFRAIFEHKRPKATEVIIVICVSAGLAMRIPEIQTAPVGGVIGGLVSAAAAAWISSFKSLIFDPPTAPHVLNYMYKFGPVLMSVTLTLCIAAELPALKIPFRNTDESIETLSFGFLFAILAAPSSVVSKRLQRMLGSFQRTLLGVLNNVLVALVSVAVIGSTSPTALTIVGSILVFLSPAANFINVNKWHAKARNALERWRHHRMIVA